MDRAGLEKPELVQKLAEVESTLLAAVQRMSIVYVGPISHQQSSIHGPSGPSQSLWSSNLLPSCVSNSFSSLQACLHTAKALTSGACKPGFERASENLGAADCKTHSPQGACLRCMPYSTTDVQKSWRQPPAFFGPAGAKGSAPGGSEAAVQPSCKPFNNQSTHPWGIS